MPTRQLKPGLNDSKRYNRCSWPAQSLYTRLIMHVDDHARYEADVELLISKLFPFGSPSGRKIPLQDAEKWLLELEMADLLVRYEAQGKWYLILKRWTERIRSEKSRFPNPPKDVLLALASRCPQAAASAALPSSAPTTSSAPMEKKVDARASVAQFAAIRDEIKALEANSGVASVAERALLRKKRRDLAALQKKQAKGDFNPLETDETSPGKTE